MESEQFSLSLPPSPGRYRANSRENNSRERPAPRKEPVSRVSDPVHPPPYTVWGARGRSATRQRPRKQVDLKCLNRPPMAASSGRS